MGGCFDLTRTKLFVILALLYLAFNVNFEFLGDFTDPQDDGGEENEGEEKVAGINFGDVAAGASAGDVSDPNVQEATFGSKGMRMHVTSSTPTPAEIAGMNPGTAPPSPGFMQRAAERARGGAHVARGWRVSKLPFDVDQPGTPRSLDLMKFNGTLSLLMHRGLFQLDPTPRNDGLVYFHRVLAVTQRGVEEDTREIAAGGTGGMGGEGGGGARRSRRLLADGGDDQDGDGGDTDEDGGDGGGGSQKQGGGGSTGRLHSDVVDAIARGEKVGAISYGNAAGASIEGGVPLGLRALTYRITKQLYDNLPPSDPKWGYKTCAIVGNSGSLLLGSHGEEIDAHEAVLRMNNAPVGGKFLKEVGQKTSFNLINFHWAKAITERTPVAQRDALLLMYEATLSHLRNDAYPKLMRMHAQGSLSVVPIMLSPDFVIRGYTTWLQLKDLIEKEKTAERMERAGLGRGGEGGRGGGPIAPHLKAAYKRKPMSGFFAMLFMLQVCDEVNMYGFSNWRPSHDKVPYHYFDRVKGTTAVHSFDLSMEVFNAVARRFKVNLVDTE